MTNKRKVAYVIMLGVIVKHLLSHEYGPLDRFLELSVLILIAYEVVMGVRHRHQIKRRNTIVNRLFAFMEKGQQLQAAIPNPAVLPDAVGSWLEQVEIWKSQTKAFLAPLSPKAASAFMLVINAGTADKQVRRPDGARFGVGGMIADAYQVLQINLDNLRQIMEKPDAYF